MSELRDVLNSAQVSAQAEAPLGGDVQVVSTRTRIRRRRFARHAGAGVAGVVALAGIAAASLWLPDALRQDPAIVPSPSLSSSPEPAPTPSDPPEPIARAFVERPVTVIEGALPSAEPLTEAVLESAGSGWTMLSYDASVMNGENVVSTGPFVIYLVSPDGVRYEAGVSERAVSVAGWEWASASVFLMGDPNTRTHSGVLDLFTGAVLDIDPQCADDGYIPLGTTLGSDGWLVRAICEDEARDALLSFSGESVTDVEGIVPSAFGRSVTNVGDTQVVYEFEREPQDKFWAQRLGSSDRIPVQLPQGYDDCYPLGASDGTGAAVVCYSDEGITVWSLDLEGGIATPIMNESQLAQVATALGHSGEHASIEIRELCFAGQVPVAVIEGLERPVAVRLDTATVVGNAQGTVERCASGTAGSVIMSSYGTVFAVDLETNTSTALAEPPSRSDSNYVVGATASHTYTLG